MPPFPLGSRRPLFLGDSDYDRDLSAGDHIDGQAPPDLINL